MPFGILTHMLHAHQHGTINLLLVNLKIIVIMNQNLEHVKVFIRVSLSGGGLLFHFKELIRAPFFMQQTDTSTRKYGFHGKIMKKMACSLGDF
ncbi:hypothetical protein SRABI133_04373 [Peribacillus simplex]|uniref:Uncharacterized protein n=1 Tax=Peribacillus simplex TaxID=1478 RepID=A0A9W4PIA9_9BACI|nr:hypothetical protein SRABI133_04373 [Peribacillus simplex]